MALHNVPRSKGPAAYRAPSIAHCRCGLWFLVSGFGCLIFGVAVGHRGVVQGNSDERLRLVWVLGRNLPQQICHNNAMGRGFVSVATSVWAKVFSHGYNDPSPMPTATKPLLGL